MREEIFYLGIPKEGRQSDLESCDVAGGAGADQGAEQGDRAGERGVDADGSRGVRAQGTDEIGVNQVVDGGDQLGDDRRDRHPRDQGSDIFRQHALTLFFGQILGSHVLFPFLRAAAAVCCCVALCLVFPFIPSGPTGIKHTSPSMISVLEIKKQAGCPVC